MNGCDVDTDNETGAISPALAGDWEGEVERQLTYNMIKTGNITDCSCVIDTTQSNLQSDQILASIKIVRKGQAKSFQVSIGFAVSI